MLENKISDLSQNIQRKFESAEEHLGEKYLMLTSTLMKTDTVSKLLANRDRKDLYKLMRDSYKEFKFLDKNLYVMHFFDKNNITVLRMHKPESYDDDLTKKRPIVAYVNSSLKAQTGFEVGKNGIVYRVTSPYIYNDKHIGIVEFGIKPDYFVDSIKKHYDVESEILIKNSQINTLALKRQFKQIGDYSIVSQSKLFRKISDNIDFSKNHQIVEFNSRYYIVITNLNLRDYQDNSVAKVIVAQDITNFILKNKNSLLLINTISIIVLIVIFIILYIIFTRYSKEIDENTNTMNKLEKKSSYFEKRANRDHLTNIYNKAYLNKYLSKFLKINRDGVILFFDIDHFKDCNDTYGHLIGDEILIQLSETIQNYLRDEDMFVRWGGEEFIVLFEDITYEIALKKAQSIRLLIENTLFTESIPITISIGVTKIKDDDSIDTLLHRADELLYKAKENGRNRVESEEITN